MKVLVKDNRIVHTSERKRIEGKIQQLIVVITSFKA